MPTHPKPTQVPRVIHDVFDLLYISQGSYAESFMALYLVLADLTLIWSKCLTSGSRVERESRERERYVILGFDLAPGVGAG